MTGGARAVVVGGGGIGAAVVDRLRAAGSEVLVWDLAGGDVDCDISDPTAVAEATATTLAQFGTPDTVTITAGIGHSGTLLDASPDDWDRIMAVNARGVWLTMRALAGPMRQSGGGSIVATSSVSAQLADRTMGLYCASKAALNMLIAVAALEWAPTVRVNAVAPGVTDTAMLGPATRTGPWLTAVARRTALGRLGTADDVAEAALALHAMHWVTGEIVRCDGGLSRHSPISPLGAAGTPIDVSNTPG